MRKILTARSYLCTLHTYNAHGISGRDVGISHHVKGRMVNKELMLMLVGITLLNTVVTHTKDCLPIDAPTLKCFSRRSDGRHKYLQMINAIDKMHLNDFEGTYGKVQATVGYRASFRSKDIAECFFGGHLTQDDCCDDHTIKIQGTNITNRDPGAWLADYFYLPRNYNGSFSVNPKIKTFFADFDLYIGLDALLCGMYFRIHGPVVHSQWDLNFCDTADLDGAKASDHPNGYFSPGVYEGNLLVQSFADYAMGTVPQPSDNTDNLATSGLGIDEGIRNSTLVFQSLKFAKITKCKRSETGFADLRAELGWDFWQSDCHHLGINLQFAAPTGKKKEPCFLFDAMIGNGNHWELGGGLTTHYTLWTSPDSEQSCSFHLDANITHMFKACIKRTFDLRDKPNSAYMLAAKYDDNTDADPPDDQVEVAVTGTDIVPAKQFVGEYAPVANLSTIDCKIGITVQADIVALFNYRCGNFSWDLGYNFWGHSCEKIEYPESCDEGASLCDRSQKNTWALKGDARMFGMRTANPVTARAIPLSATQSGASILNGLNQTPLQTATDTTAIATDNNRNIDNPGPAAQVSGGVDLFNVASGVQVRINTSATPVMLKCSQLDFTRIRSVSHTVFTNLSHTWEGECWSPYCGAGLSAEFGSNTRTCNDDTNLSPTIPTAKCGPCVSCAVSQWSVWVSGGVAFN